MTSEQVIANEAIAKSVAEATRVAIQAIAKLQLGGRWKIQWTQNIQVRGQ